MTFMPINATAAIVSQLGTFATPMEESSVSSVRKFNTLWYVSVTGALVVVMLTGDGAVVAAPGESVEIGALGGSAEAAGAGASGAMGATTMGEGCCGMGCAWGMTVAGGGNHALCGTPGGSGPCGVYE